MILLNQTPFRFYIKIFKKALNGGFIMKCSFCETENRDDVKFCKNCGAELDSICEENIHDSTNHGTKHRLLIIVLIGILVFLLLLLGILAFFVMGNQHKTELYSNNSYNNSVSSQNELQKNKNTTAIRSGSETDKDDYDKLIGRYYQSRDIVVYDDKYIAKNNESLEFCSESKTGNTINSRVLAKGTINNFITDGENIFYSMSLETAGDENDDTGDPMPADCKIVYTKTDGDSEREIVTTNGYGYLLGFVDGELYYTEYKQDYEGYCLNPMVICSVNISTSEKEIITSNVCDAYQNNNRIVFIDMTSSDSETQSLKIYDTKNKKIQKVVSDNLIADINCDNDELFFSQESNGTGSDYAPKRFYHYNFTSGEKECLASCSGNNTLNIGHSDCKYVFYNCYDIDKEEYTYYRYNMELGKEEKIDGLRENHYYSVFTDSDKAYYCSSDNSIQIYPLKNKETVVSDDFSRIYYSGNDVVAVRDNNIFIRGDNGDISKNGIKKP